MRTTLRRALNPTLRHLSSTSPTLPTGPLSATQIDTLLATPTWSIQSLLPSTEPTSDSPSISRKTLHHLLRLSALPLPTSKAEESEMLQTLSNQLHFVNSLQSVDTTGIAPLQGLLHDETEPITHADIHAAQERVEKGREADQERDLRESGRLFKGPNVRKIGSYLVVDDKGEGAVAA